MTSSSTSTETGTSVLVVDTDSEELEETVSFLREKTDYVTEEAKNTDEAAEAAGERLDCVVSAYDLGETDVFSLYEEIKSETRKPYPPMVLFVEDGSEEVASRAVNSDVMGYVKKSSDGFYEKLVERVEDAVSEHADKVRADRYGAVIEALGYPVYVVDEHGEFSFVNDCFVDLTGYSSDEIIGSPTSLMKDEETVEEAESHLGSILSSDGPDTVRFEVEIESADGDTIPCIDHMGYLPYDGETFRGHLSLAKLETA
ncbi:MAG: PAS domain S-box protein [Halobacteria archaeon]|nr:PAS domain S-box protein [Halobacteria archaeon]